ncbi:ABC transporter permease [Segnochrobactrum spirostomi]|uniref:ABC transporter permease n=1 Tax=Segnochrobactrum spirostomi TaxID=2608987 RepID=A0A6A7Y880_9HYPH|nr:ABC transporter permease [Segnochrobactrum spirostomi]MQT14905.1 ABC transporter permease [Segnochrobactrum spirostomi]
MSGDPARRRALVLAGLLSPATVLMIVFLVAPMLIVIGYSFSARDDYGGVLPVFTSENYTALLDPLYLHVLWNSVSLAGLTTIICLIVGYPAAYFIAFRAGRLAPVLLVLMLIPFWINFLIRISAWVVLLGRNGLVNAGLVASGLLDAPIGMLGTEGAVLVGLVYAFLPTAIFPIYAALNPIPPILIEAADDLGAGPIAAFWRVTLPLSLPGVMAAILFVFVPAMGAFAIPALLGGGKSIVIGNLIVQLFLEFRNIPLGAAVSVVLLAASIALILVYMRILQRLEAARS